jgi:Asp-tRNA(Asn)/Glu-tRNA(Gln) amidotransferase A subunit family amidase
MSQQPSPESHSLPLSRRTLFQSLAAASVGSLVFQKALASSAAEAAGPPEKRGPVTAEQIQQAEWVAGIELSEADRKTVARILTRWQQGLQELREVKLPNSVPFPLSFNPAPGLPPESRRGSVEPSETAAPRKPDSKEDLAFLPLTALAALLRERQVSSTELTKLYLERLEEYDPVLSCVVTLTRKTALEQAGRYRGPLHGIPWGAKDLIAYPGYPTTWGAEPFKEQKLDTRATVAKRLDDAGAVLVAKLSLGALALGDRWFLDKQTKNPWDPAHGSSGSSAGSASAAAAGLVGFALGSETLGSIVSPSRVCGTTGLRPTFGRVSRHGCMTLAWSMDKIGPIARSVEDCALVFGAIHGRDGLDASATDRPFTWPLRRDLGALKVGYFKAGTPRRDLDVLKEIGVQLVPIELPRKYLLADLSLILYAESAAAFDELTRAGVGKGLERWRGSFQAGQFIAAVDYIRANRVRALLMQEMAELMEKVDLYIGGEDLLLTNLTGHPCVVLPAGFVPQGKVEVPYSVTFTGRLFGESELLAVAHAYQRATGFHLRRPRMERLKKKA